MSFRMKLLATALCLAGTALCGYATAQVAPAPAPQAAAPAPAYPPSVFDLVAKTKAQIKTIKMDEFKAAFDKKDVGLLIDVREDDEFADGFVPGAVNIPRGLIEFRIWKLVGFPANTKMDTKMTLVCASGARCALAAKSLQDLGFTNATAVDMAFANWVKAGFPVSKPK
jgi:rhodanese-related sulfurtransferase